MNNPTEKDQEENHFGMPESVARQNVLEDPATAALADILGVERKEYAECVLGYAKDPTQGITLEVLDDDPAVALLDTVDAVVSWFAGVASGDISVANSKGLSGVEEFTKNEDASDQSRAAAGISVDRSAPDRNDLKGEVRVSGEAKTGALLKSQLLEQRQQSRMSSEERRARRTRN